MLRLSVSGSADYKSGESSLDNSAAVAPRFDSIYNVFNSKPAVRNTQGAAPINHHGSKLFAAPIRY